MNLYEKIAEARIQFQQMNVKKTGKNTYAGYTYFTLDEILPAVNVIAKALKFVCVFDTTADNATLTLIDIEKPEDKVTFSCAYVRTITKTIGKDGKETTDTQGASLKGCHPVQNEGATITYLKRYLYLNAFEISEGDVLDATMNPNDDRPKQKDKAQNAKTDDTLNALVNAVNKFPKDKVQKVLGEFGYEQLNEVPEQKRREFFRRVQEA